jgi:hypothetical protein
VITATGKEIVSDFVPYEIGAIERLMKEEGMLQRYPKDQPSAISSRLSALSAERADNR